MCSCSSVEADDMRSNIHILDFLVFRFRYFQDNIKDGGPQSSRLKLISGFKLELCKTI